MRGHQEAVGAEQRAEHGCGGADLLQQEGGGSNLQDRQPNRITSFPSGQKPEPVLLRSKLHQEKPSSELCLLSITSAALRSLADQCTKNTRLTWAVRLRQNSHLRRSRHSPTCRNRTAVRLRPLELRCFHPPGGCSGAGGSHPATPWNHRTLRHQPRLQPITARAASTNPDVTAAAPASFPTRGHGRGVATRTPDVGRQSEREELSDH